jgi:hypothetical protein
VTLGSRVSPAASNSLTSGGKLVPVALISSSSAAGARFTTNSPDSAMLRSESFSPTDVNCTMGGFVDATVKNECGARLSTPSGETLETQAMGRGTTTAVSSR